MPLDPTARALYSRHLLLPEIGELGQERLCVAGARASASAEPRAVAAARDYLERAGVAWGDEAGAADCAVPDAGAVARAAGRADLEEAAALLLGALAAVETIKSVTGAGRLVGLAGVPVLSEDPP